MNYKVAFLWKEKHRNLKTMVCTKIFLWNCRSRYGGWGSASYKLKRDILHLSWGIPKKISRHPFPGYVKVCTWEWSEGPLYTSIEVCKYFKILLVKTYNQIILFDDFIGRRVVTSIIRVSFMVLTCLKLCSQ